MTFTLEKKHLAILLKQLFMQVTIFEAASTLCQHKVVFLYIILQLILFLGCVVEPSEPNSCWVFTSD